MLTIYLDADACPVKEEVYRVARRYGMHVAVVANERLRVPADPLIELVERPGFGADWIAEQAGRGDIVVTADIPLAARCLAKEAFVLDPRGHPFTDNDIGSALAMRDLMDELRKGGTVIGGPAAMTPKDRSRSSPSSTRPSTACDESTCHGNDSDVVKIRGWKTYERGYRWLRPAKAQHGESQTSRSTKPPYHSFPPSPSATPDSASSPSALPGMVNSRPVPGPAAGGIAGTPSIPRA
jgi:uncharacterized protein